MPKLWTPRKGVQLSPAARLIVDYLRRNWMTPAELADRAGIARNTLYTHINGEMQGMSYYLVERLARATAPDLTLEQLLEAAGYPQSYRTAQPRNAKSDLDDFAAYLRADNRFPPEMQAALAEAMTAYRAQRTRRGRSIPVDAEPPTQVLPAVSSAAIPAASPPAGTIESRRDTVALSEASSAAPEQQAPEATPAASRR